MSISPAIALVPAQSSLALRRLTICCILALGLLASIIFSAAHGPANIPYGDVARLVLRGLNFPVGQDLPQSDFLIVNVIRLPRILIGALVGAPLAWDFRREWAGGCDRHHEWSCQCWPLGVAGIGLCRRDGSLAFGVWTVHVGARS